MSEREEMLELIEIISKDVLYATTVLPCDWFKLVDFITAATPAPGYAHGFEACRSECLRVTIDEREKCASNPGYMMAVKIRNAIAALPAPAGEEDWQPIETAPKDGTYALVYRSKLGSRAVCVEHFKDGFWIAGSCMWPGEPTHWRPLPAPPTILAKPAQEGQGS